MARKKRYPIQIDEETKAALDKHKSATSSKSYGETVAKLSRAKVTKGTHKKHTGIPASIVDAAILLCWTLDKNGTTYQIKGFRDKTRAEIIQGVRETLSNSFDPRHTTWKDLYPVWFEQSLDEYVDNRLKSLKRRGFIDNKSKGIWSMAMNVLSADETQMLLYIFVYIEPHKQLNIPQILRDRR
tara:strand:+ start:133 stop:684 length:552 start_codon:yes stop_codon:yes gene_type:complete